MTPRDIAWTAACVWLGWRVLDATLGRQVFGKSWPECIDAAVSQAGLLLTVGGVVWLWSEP